MKSHLTIKRIWSEQAAKQFLFSAWQQRAKAKDLKHFNESAMLLSENNYELLKAQNNFDDSSSAKFRAFSHFYTILFEYLNAESQLVLELCAGNGLHTINILKTGSRIIAVDISEAQLEVLRERTSGEAKTVVADMEKLPFPDDFFDAVIVIQSLSYGRKSLVDDEVKRVLKPSTGLLIAMDCLGNNPFYQLARLKGCIDGSRSLMTIFQMPKISRLKAWSEAYSIDKLLFLSRNGNLITENTSKKVIFSLKSLVYLIRTFLAYRFIFVGHLSDKNHKTS